MHWSRFIETAPKLGAEGVRLLEKQGLGLLGTIRRDGTPRICPIETTFIGGRLVLGMPQNSRKAQDLKRDPRCTIHSPVMAKDNVGGDFKLTGTAEEILDEAFFATIADLAEREFGSRPPFRAAYYASIDIKSASYINSATRQVLAWEEASGLVEKLTAGISD